MSFALPDSPKSPIYREILEDIKGCEDPDEGRIRFRAWVEEDFWAFVRFACSFGQFLIREPGHPMIGEPWADHPWVFERCRELQKDAEEGVTGKFYNWPRFHFKSELITKILTIWELLKDPGLTIAILTFKVDQTGDALFENIRTELQKNPVLLEHWPDRLSEKTHDYSLWTNTALSILRPVGPKEPSISVHSVLNPPTSGHFRRLVIDDAVTDKTVENILTIRKTFRGMQVLTPLRAADTITRWIGTIWDQEDPYMQAIREGMFTSRSLWTCYDKEGQGVLHTNRFLAEWRKDMGEYLFSCNMLNTPAAKGDQYFRNEWLDTRYANPPREEAKGKVVYLFTDFSSGVEEGDYTTMWAIGLGEDRHYYTLDLHRDRMQLNDMLDTLFRLVKVWKPEAVWIEHFGDTAYYSTIKREMEARKIRFPLRKITRIGGNKTVRSKEQRIQKLQPMMERGEIYWPEYGFGHGSSSDMRDTFEQFRQDEYNFWTPIKGATLYDDMLDALSWIAQPEMQAKLRWPETVEPEEPFDPHNLTHRLQEKQRGNWSGISGWAY